MLKRTKKTIDKGIAYLKKNGMRAAVKRAGRKLYLSREIDYEKWLEEHRKQRRERISKSGAAAADSCGICVVVGGRLPEELSEQAYYLFTEEGDVPEPDIKEAYAAALKEHPGAELLYCDSDGPAHGGQGAGQRADGVRVKCKPDFDPFYLESTNYIGSGFLAAGRLVRELGAPKSLYGYLLACTEKAKEIVHVPEILCHEGMQKTLPGREEGRWKCEQESLQEHFMRRGVRAKVSAGLQPWTRRITYALPEQPPMVSVLIPNRDHRKELRACIDSIRRFAGYEPYEILVLENNSTAPEILSYYEELQKEKDVRILTCEGAFNYSRVNNLGAEEARGEYLLFLNNDTEMTAPGCMRELMNYAQLPEVGAVGAQMFYGDDTIQHAGVVLGYGGMAGHAFEGLERSEAMKRDEIICARCCSAVTAACMMVRRSVFEQAGGFDEAFGVAYNDIDLCLRIGRLGKRIVYTPYAQLYHYESQTRGLELTDEKAERVRRESGLFRERWKEELENGDPCYNPNLTLEKADYSLRR